MQLLYLPDHLRAIIFEYRRPNYGRKIIEFLKDEVMKPENKLGIY